ncbi:MAG: 3-oxoacyl-[acyl-carrier protein] reductase [Paraglaciecola sp.]|jgi:3-oxoacyl-[acyl-carrier protein] reductase
MDFTNKTVLITGGSRGIGKATAIAFAARGAQVAINFKSNSRAAQETVNLLAGDGHFAAKADIGNPAAVLDLVDTVISEFGKIDIVVNNAGIYREHPVLKTSFEKWQESWQETLDVNLIGPANVCFCVAKHMAKAGGGRIINVSSRGAFRGEPEYTAYGASKAGLNSLSQSLARELGRHNICVGVVAPGFVETDMTRQFLDSKEGEAMRNQSPLGRVATPEEVAQAIMYFAADGAAFMTGGIIDVNGASYLRS